MLEKVKKLMEPKQSPRKRALDEDDTSDLYHGKTPKLMSGIEFHST